MTLLRGTLLAIGAITILTGSLQLVAAGRILAWIAPGSAALSSHLFATVGMFMIVVGGALVHAVLLRSGEQVVTLWVAVQKFAAAALVAIGCARGVFIPLMFGVAAFDAASGVLALMYRQRSTQ